MTGRRLKSASAVMAVSALLGACESVLEGDVRMIRVAGAVYSAETGEPIAGAAINLERAAFVFQLPLASATTDLLGQYRIEQEIRCKHNADLYLASGDAYLVVAWAEGHERQSNINIGAPLRCISSEQVINFTLPGNVLAALFPLLRTGGFSSAGPRDILS